ncbi:MAG: Sporulation kinase [Anaerospora sp.]|nr:Sporulation kinase [Anaerospora sp.]
MIQQVISGKVPDRDTGSFPELDMISSAVHDLRETLKQREAEYKTLLDNCPYAIARIDKKLRRIYINQAFHTLWGTSIKSFYKQSNEQAAYSELINLPLGEELEKVFCTGKEYEYDSCYIDELGVCRHYRNRVTPEKDEMGRVQTALVISRDVTEKIQSEERFFKAFHMNPSMVAIVSQKDKTYIDVNESFSQIVGICREEIIGRNVDEIKFLQAGEAEKIREHMATTCKLINCEIKYCTKHGETRIALISSDSITLGSVECYLSVMTDITDKKQLENELARFERLNIIGEMAAGIGHEVRNPMTTVRGYLQLFKRKEAFASYGGQLDTMIEELDRANSF